MQRGFNEPRTRDHYHIRTRISKKRTRSDHKTKAYCRCNVGAIKYQKGQKGKQIGKGRQLQRKYEMKWSRPCYNILSNDQLTGNRVSVCSNAVIGATMQNGIKSNFNVERLMKAWRIDKETALKTIRATTQRYKRKHDAEFTNK